MKKIMVFVVLMFISSVAWGASKEVKGSRTFILDIAKYDGATLAGSGVTTDGMAGVTVFTITTPEAPRTAGKPRLRILIRSLWIQSPSR